MNLLSFLGNGFEFIVVSGFTRHGFCTVSTYYDRSYRMLHCEKRVFQVILCLKRKEQ